MTRIFLTLSVLSTALLVAGFVLGLSIDDAKSPANQDLVTYHFLTALAALVFAVLVHAIVLTYFMGTGRWLEETSSSYRLDDAFRLKNRSLKYRTIPLMVVCMTLLVSTGAFGAAVDPASPVQFSGWLGLPGPTIHLLMAATTLFVNVLVNWYEYQALSTNGQLIEDVMQQVRAIRTERGLPV